MNTEQLKQLKPGDEIFIRARYKEIAGDGDVLFLHSARNICDDVVKKTDYTHPKNVILPPSAPKCDPCRLFKKGDKATPRIVNGRKPVCGIDGVAAKINSVELIVESNEGERENGTVDIKFPCGTIGQIDPVYLELVTPVEERSPYRVGKGIDEKLIYKNNELYAELENAREAERVCNLLNEQHRKEQNNG